VKVDKVFVVSGKFLSRDIDEGAVKVVDRLDKVFSKALKGEILGSLNLAFCPLLKVAVVGDGTEVFVLSIDVKWMYH
jgi:hypothetical protein